MTLAEEFQSHLQKRDLPAIRAFLVKELQANKVAVMKTVANALGSAAYSSRTQEALFIINDLAPLLNNSACFDADNHAPLLFAIHFKNLDIINALTPKLTREQLEKEIEMAGSALDYAIRGRYVAGIKAICKRGIQLALETPHQIDINQLAHKIIRQIDSESIVLTEKEHQLAQKSILKNYYLAYFQNCRELNDFNVLRQVFFLAFKYLKDENTRAGFFVKTFGNHDLTRDITQTAKSLVTQINGIDSRSDNPMRQLLHFIVQAIDIARRYRFDHATESHYDESSIEPGMDEGWGIEFDYKTPYGNGAFEKNIIAGLNAIKAKQSDVHLENAIDSIIKKITSYKPTQVHRNVKTYTPS